MPKKGRQPAASSGVLGKEGDRRVRINMTPNEAFEFLSKLASDDELRKRLQKSPRKELAKHHIHLPKGPIRGRVTLPPKSRLKTAYTRLTLGREFKSESAALTAAAIGYAWFHAAFTGWRFQLVAPRRTKRKFGS